MSSILSLLQFKGLQSDAATAADAAIAVTAGAGSGKTRALAGRFLGLLETGLPLRSLVAITFTDKAAREMRTRIRGFIQQWLAEAPQDVDRTLWNTAFSELDAARIGTIHSLCAQILRAHPAEAGVDPAFEVLDENVAAMLKARAVESALAWGLADPSAARLFGPLSEYQVRQTIAVLLERRLDVREPQSNDAVAALDSAGNDPLAGWSAALAAWLDARLNAVEGVETLAGVQARQEDDKLEIARRAVLSDWQAIQTARAAGDVREPQSNDWDALFTALLALRGHISTGGAKANWDAANLETARDAMRALREHLDATLLPWLDKTKPLLWALDCQMAALLPDLSRLFERAVTVYQALKDETQALDFDDLESRAADLLTRHPGVRAHWQSEVRAVLVDEFQDTNERQRQIVYALTSLANPERKTQSSELFVVGDAKQCFVPGTPILTPGGYKSIEQIVPDDHVIAASGRGRTHTFRVKQVHQRPYSGPIIIITTASGFEIRCTPEHAVFTRLIPDMSAYYVYLMRHQSKGYRIGITRGYRTGEKRIANGLDSRCRQEGGDAIWVLGRFHSRKEAQMYEQLYLARYGLPGLCFKSKGYQELDQAAIDFVFASIPTYERAVMLANDLGIDLATPHFIPTVAREAVALVYFGGKGNRLYTTHRIHFETRNVRTAQKLAEFGVRKAKPSRHYLHRWRIGTERTGYEDARDFSSRLAQQADTLLVERFALTMDKRWEQTPVGQVFPGLQIPIVDGEQVMADEIVRVVRQQFDGPVYDFQVSHVHNYVANHIVVHNSIYRFRGADVTVFRRVQDDVAAAGGRHVDLDLTFRAHRPLVEALNALLAPVLGLPTGGPVGQADGVERPYQVPFAPLRAYRPAPRDGIAAPYVEFHLGIAQPATPGGAGEDAETGRRAAAAALAARLWELHDREQVAWQDMALLFRASSAFPTYEDALERAGVPFVTVAGRGFYERPEVRDLLNALAAIADPGDDLALAGLLRSPAFGLSDAALYVLRRGAETGGRKQSLWAALNSRQPSAVSGQPPTAEVERACETIATLHAWVGRVPIAMLLKQFLDLTHYRAALRLVGGIRALRNVDKLLADAHGSRLVGVSEFLEYVQNLRDVGARESEAPAEVGLPAGGPVVQGAGAVQLMTVHKAKGLEFPVVVIADAAHAGGARAGSVVIDPEWGVLLDVRQEECRPAMYRLAALRQAEMEEAESRRLLYVAATRAKEKLIVSGHVKVSAAKSDPGRLLLNGWLEWLGQIVGLDQLRLPAPLSTPTVLDLSWDGPPLRCVLHPPQTSPAIAPPPSQQPPISNLPPPPSPLVAPLVVAEADVSDAKTRQRESDPPPRVWRVVPRARRPTGPAWVIGQLVHAALRRWRFPDQTFVSLSRTMDLEPFLFPYALEAGLTDRREIGNAINEARRLLARFQTSPLYAEMDAAERHHELPFSLPPMGLGGLPAPREAIASDAPRSGIIDALYRAPTDGRWVVAEFKTDEIKATANLDAHIRREQYDQQMLTYVEAVTQLLGEQPRGVLVFLNVGGEVRSVAYSPPVSKSHPKPLRA